MKATRTCGECGIPLGISRTMSWNADGTITQKSDPGHRMIFFESGNLDLLWSRLSELLGVTDEHVWETVIVSKSRATRSFLYRTLPWYVNMMSRFIGYKTMISTIEAQGLVMGYGKITVGGQFPTRGRPERITVYVEDPYSLPLFCGDFKGAAEVAERRRADVSYQDLDSRRHQIDVAMRKERMEEEQFEVEEKAVLKRGGFVYHRCGSCGAPLDLQKFSWDLEAGVIREIETKRRMAFFGTAGLKTVFTAFSHELGDRVNDIIIDVERDNTLSAMSEEEARSGVETLRSQAAIRGLGLLEKMDIDGSGMHMVMTNPAIPDYIIGLAAGIFELVAGRRGSREWRLEPDGDLTLEISPG
jgi:hypothetical protein